MDRLLTSPQRHLRDVNVCVMVDYAQGGVPLINEACMFTSDDPLFSAAQALRRMADLLEFTSYDEATDRSR